MILRRPQHEDTKFCIGLLNALAFSVVFWAVLAVAVWWGLS